MAVARDIRAELQHARGGRVVTVRWLRNRFGYSRLTRTAITEIGQALADASIRVTPPLRGLDLDDKVELTIDDQASSRGRWFERTIRGGLKVWQVLVGLLGLAATVAALASFAEQRWPHHRRALPPLRGDLKILVADFGTEDKSGRTKPSQEGHDAALSLYDSLAARLRLQTRTARDQEPLAVAIRGPSQTERVTGADEGARARSLAQLAQKSNADVVVYGNLQSSVSHTTFVPQFYVTPRKLEGAEELAGQYDFGTPIRAPGRIDANPEASRVLRDQIVLRTRALADFIVGLNDFSSGSYGSAEHRLRNVAASPGWAEAPVVYLFLGNSELRLERLVQAQHAYRSSLNLDPTYARARFGLAEIQFQRACGAGASPDQTGLARAIAAYRQVLTAPQEPGGFPMRGKINLGIGKAYLCFTRPRCALAESHFKAVIHDYSAGMSGLAEDTAEAWGGLGVALELCHSHQFSTERARLDTIADRYRHAAELATLSARQAYYWSELGRILADLHESTSAISAYDNAIQSEPSAQLRGEYQAARSRLLSR